MKIITVCSRMPAEPYYRPDAFFASCRRFGFDPIVLGKEGYGGLGSKLRLLKQFLDAQSDDFDTHMIFCDSFDVVFQRSPLEAMNEFRAWPNQIRLIFNAQRTLWPFDQEVFDLHPLSETTYRFLNSGFAIGEISAFSQMLEELQADKIPDDHDSEQGRVEPNDQPIIQRFYVSERKRLGIALDRRAQICQTCSDVLPEELDFSEALITNKETGASPIAIHINGRKEEWLPLILPHLNLEK